MNHPLPIAPFSDPDVTAKGEARASVAFDTLQTLWFNTGTLCNIECAHCYIESSPTNDRLSYLSAREVAAYLDEIDVMGLGPVEIGFTGGEPFMNPDMAAMAEDALERGHEVLILTNAMKPMMRPRVQDALLRLNERFGSRLTLRISLDHFEPANHDAERGAGTFEVTLEGMIWLARNGFTLSAAGRRLFDEDEAVTRAGFKVLFAEHAIAIDAHDRAALVIFPEMDPSGHPPEITTACWDILGKSPREVMCASSRMVVKRKGDDAPMVLACTLIPYDEAFETGRSLAASLKPVKLNHRFCAQFCVLGGASCSA